jgi:Uma2 family endonuclease
MSTVDRHETRLVPPLVPGQRLDQPTFHERYLAMPPETRAELVGGVVYMPSPVRSEHGDFDDVVSYWLVHYRRYTAGVLSGKNVTTILGDSGEVQPDSQLRILEDRGGLTRIVDGYVVGPPEFIVEIARSSRRFDLGLKKRDYERAGVLEYLVLSVDPEEALWFLRQDDRLVPLAAGSDGVFRSKVFPGLWLDPVAFFAEDLDRMMAVLDEGLATAEHAAFAARLADGS